MVQVAVILASLNRPQDLTHMLHHLGDQTMAPALIILSLEKTEDAPTPLPPHVEVVLGTRGLCAQRNRGLAAALGRCDVVAFFDDDFVPSRYTIEQIAKTFENNPDVVGATGLVLADGVTSGGVEYEEAKKIVAQHDETGGAPNQNLKTITTAYGCNMAFRSSAITDLWFDEKLPLYGWQEDVDFAGQVRRRGRMVYTEAFAGVHCGVTRSRMPGQRLGFSQIVNPVYLVRKGSMLPSHALGQMFRNLAANHWRALKPEPHIDRRGRVIGNWLGLSHVLTQRADPTKVLDL